jgi:hypothetical protein
LAGSRLGKVSLRLLAPSVTLPFNAVLTVRHASPHVASDYSLEGSELTRLGDFGAAMVRLATPETTLTYWIPRIGVFEARIDAVGAIGERSVVATKLFEFMGQDTNVFVDLSKPEGQMTIRVALEQEGGPDIPLAGVLSDICDAGPPSCVRRVPIAGTAADGTSTVASLVQSTYHLRTLTNLPEGSYVASAVQENRDVLQDGIRISNRPATVDIRVKKGSGLVEGEVVDKDGQRVRNAAVGLVPDGPLEQTAFQPLRRSANTDQDGRFVFSGLAPGTYRLYSHSTEGIPVLIPGHQLSRDGVLVEVRQNETSTAAVEIADTNP